MKIVLDCMGNDHGVDTVVKGGLLALEERKDISLVFVGQEPLIAKALDSSADLSRIRIVHAEEVIDNDESPVKAIRNKKESSLVKGLHMLKEEEADGFISSGSTGALLTGALLIVGRVKGIQRAALTTLYPTRKEPLLLLDIGANVDCKPEYLTQFAVMGSIYANQILKRQNPKVFLANIGAESEKGNSLTKEAYAQLQQVKDINFAGNIEARDLMKGEADVVVCDGFVGNMILKTTEGTALSIFSLLKALFYQKPAYRFAALLLKKGLKQFKKVFDYGEYGGAPLLGIQSPVFKAHGSSDEYAIKNAVLKGADYIEKNIAATIEAEISKIKGEMES